MNKKNTARHLEKKFWEWIKSLPVEMQHDVAENTFITGGCIASLLLGEKVNDYDIYFKRQDILLDVVDHYLEKFCAQSGFKFGFEEDASQTTNVKGKIYRNVDDDGRVRIVVKSAGVVAEGKQEGYSYFEMKPSSEASDYIEQTSELLDRAEKAQESAIENSETEQKEKYRPIFLSSNAITLSDGVQLVIRFYGTPSEVHKNFDYVHCTNYWTLKNGLTLNKAAITSLLTKQLEYSGSKYPICSLFRMRKFLNRGWRITAGQILKIALQVSDLDLSKVEVLEDQLIGVDVAYFEELVTKLKENDPDVVERGYLIELIEEMFEE